MYLAVGQTTSRGVWRAIETALGSSTRVRCLNLLGQFQSLRQGDLSPSEYLGQAQQLVENLALAGRPMSLEEQNLYVFKGLRPEFWAMTATLVVSGNAVSIPQLADYIQAQQFIHSDEIPTGIARLPTGSPSTMYAGRSRGQSGHGGGRNSCGGENRGGYRGGQNRGGRGRGGLRCQICRANGHSALHCYRRYSDAPPSPPQANVAVTADSATDMAPWYPDTGATSHATPDARMMS
ncbi:PREDICTED: uncharacterized protein LOC109189823 [Ipomoea nil]|uniref:uncharacterized protein LOC109189823 n=1 Tax=Ipomoea nil TaxID=35883 RepID=UPI0009009BF1|nr:PREDICTED: uncharacterized protein LOC109189823 [Ipomoea nil]